MVKRTRAELLTMNLPQLQNLIKRDSKSYKEEFLVQWQHFESSVAIFELAPDKESQEFAEQIMFISQVYPCYPQECKGFPKTIMNILTNHYQIMSSEIRRKMVQALILLRNRNMIPQNDVISLFFTLFKCQDKSIRSLLHTHIVADIKNANAKAKNNKLNKSLQNFMYTMIKDVNETAAKKSLEVMIELYRKNVWNDSKTVNVICEACLSDAPKIVAPAVHFFLGTNDNVESDSEDDNIPNLDSMKHANQVNKKKKSRKTQMDKALSLIKKKERRNERAETFNFSALHLVNDPQGFSESLLATLKRVTSKNTIKF
jgi:protein SDA1